MEITKEYLEKRIREYRQAGEQLKLDAIANQGAAQALEAVLAELGKLELDKDTLSKVHPRRETAALPPGETTQL